MGLRSTLGKVPGVRWGRDRLLALRSRALGLHYPERVAVASANEKTLEHVRSSGARCVAEIGIYKGHTTRGIAEVLNNEGEIHIFDFQDKVDRVKDELKRAGYHNVIAHGNSTKVLDSYVWSLASVLEQHTEPYFDYVFIDGAHTWVHDGPAFLLIDRLLKPGGYVDFDDYSWTFDQSPSLRPEVFPKTRQWYTDEQIHAEQVRMVIDLLVRRDPRYREVVANKVFQKQP